MYLSEVFIYLRENRSARRKYEGGETAADWIKRWEEPVSLDTRVRRSLEKAVRSPSSTFTLQGEFVDNVPRLPVRIINHLFPMNWRTVREACLRATLIF